jgi:predicted deacylase
LSTDFVWIGSADAKKIILHTSGVHGVEGFPGSASAMWIMDGFSSGELKLSDDCAIVFAHIINPWGMAWLRRVNEDNVDLNRNFLPPGEAYDGEPENYEKLDHLLNPTSMKKGREYYTIRAAWHSFKLGFANAKQAVQEGQYTRPKSLQYGGAKLSEASQNFIDWCERKLTHAKQVVWIDFHTGLGPFGIDSLLVAEGTNEEALKARYGGRIQPLDPAKGVAYKIRGGIQAGIESRFPNIEWTSITQEFGTIKPIPLLKLARAENRITQWSGKTPLRLLQSDERRNMLDAFNPRSMKWRKMILLRSRAIIEDAIAHLSEE